MRIFRSMLSAPGHQRDTIAEAAACGADALLLDLEDRVPAERKAEAREVARHSIEALSAKTVMYVRVNPLASGMTREDLDAIAVPGLDGIRVPKVDSPETVKAVDSLLTEVERAHGLKSGSIQICIGVESARAVYLAYDLCRASPRVSSLAAGLGKGGDLQKDMAYIWSEDGAETLYIRSKLVLAARAAAIPIPLDGGYGAARSYDPARDDPGLIRHAQMGRQLGYRAKICFHPSQVPHVNRIFVPTPQEIESSRRLAERFDGQHTGGIAIAEDEQLANARRVLAWAQTATDKA